MSEQLRSRKERRSGPDLLIRTVQFLNIVCGSLLIVALVLFDRARPRIETFFDRFLNVHLNHSWNRNLLDAQLYVVFALSLLSVQGLLCNSQRTRRKYDHYSKTLIFSVIYSLAAIALTLIFRPR